MERTVEIAAEMFPETGYIQPEFDLGLPPKIQSRKLRLRRSTSPLTMTRSVGEFHVAFQLPISRRPEAHVPEELSDLRIELLREEFEEFKDAVEREDVISIADALGDIVYVAYGSAVTYGIDLDAVLREIHRSNMSKLGEDGHPILRGDGKVLKSAAYRPPDIAGVLFDQPPQLLA